MNEKPTRSWVTKLHSASIKSISRNNKVARMCLTTHPAILLDSIRKELCFTKLLHNTHVRNAKLNRRLSKAQRSPTVRGGRSHTVREDWICCTVITSTIKTITKTQAQMCLHRCLEASFVNWLRLDYEGLWAGWRRLCSPCPKLTVSGPLIKHRLCTVMVLCMKAMI